MSTKKALITGITGQDGSYLAELLLSKGYEVHGIIRRASTFNTKRIDHIYQDPHETGRRLFLHYGDMADAESIRKLIYIIQPDEIYNFGAQSHVRVSFDIPEYTANIDALGSLRILEAIRDYQDNTGKKVKFYQASSSEIFGSTPPPQNERSPFHPRSPYGCSKVFAYHMCVNYREAYGIFAVNGILFNHESERRGETFVTRKITRGIARIKAGLDKKIYLGNLDTRRDWGYAPEYMEAAWLMMQENEPDDYVIGTGESHSIKEFIEIAFEYAGIPNWENYIGIDPKYYRPTEVQNLIADSAKARIKLGWSPKTKFENIIHIMLEHDFNEHGLILPKTSRTYLQHSNTFVDLNYTMEKSAKIYVAGHTGLVGSAIVRALNSQGYTNIICRTHEELDLTDQNKVREFLEKEKPEYVYLAAAKVGGIYANNTYPADFIFQNIQIETNVIHESYKHGVKKLLFLGSTCIYPKHAPQPMREEHLLTNSLEPTNEAYAIAKIAGIKMCQSYNRQYGTNFIACMPTNIYGINDNFHPLNSHVIPALLQKFHEAKINSQKAVTVWGTGNAVREFLNVDDLSSACIFLMEHFNPTKEQNEKGEIFLNIGTGEGITIKELTELIKKVVGYQGEILWDTTKPDGTPIKISDVSRIQALGWKHKIQLSDGIRSEYEWYKQNKSAN